MNQIARLPANLSLAEPPLAGGRRRRARQGVWGVLDLGSSKTVCLIARIEADGEPRVLGFGWQRSRGIKGGNIVDLRDAEATIRQAVAQAEEMADHKLTGVIVNLSCGQPHSQVQHIQWPIGGRAVTAADIRAVLHEARRRAEEEGRETVHAIPLGFTIDATPGVDDPRGMICDMLGARLHLVGASQASLRNLGLALAACDLEVEELVAAPFAAALATLVEDEKLIGATVVDMGGGATTLAVFQDGHLLHTATLPVGGWNVSNDLALGLTTTITHAERVKTLHGGVLAGHDDGREFLPIPQVGEEEEQLARIPRSAVVGVIRPRLAETLELVRDRLEAAGLGPEVGKRVVLTGGASQLAGVREMAAEILGRPVRLGRPHQVRGLPEALHRPDFAATVGLLGWGAGDGRPPLDLDPAGPRAGWFSRLAEWWRDRL